MCETAANWVDHLLPQVPYRQWVLSFDSSLAVRLGYDVTALDSVCRSLARRLMQTLRRLTKRDHSLRSVRDLHPGIVTVVQRFRADLGLFVHLHVLATDGAFEQQPDGNVVFHPLTDLHERDLVRVLDAVAADVADAALPDDLEVDVDAALASCVQLSLSTPTAPTAVSTPQGLVAFAHGMNLHAATTVDGRDRRRLERVCKLLAAPPIRPRRRTPAPRRTAVHQTAHSLRSGAKGASTCPARAVASP
jgi:hypothetical protein